MIEKSQSAPRVQVNDISPGSLTISSQSITVPISGTVNDSYAGLTEQSVMKNIYVRQSGKLIGTLPMATVAGAESEWAPYAKSFTFGGTVQVPLWVGDHTLSISTDVNEMGVRGVGQVNFVVTAEASATDSEMSTPTMAYVYAVQVAGPLDTALADTIQLIVPGVNPWLASSTITLAETAPASQTFVDSTNAYRVEIDGQLLLQAGVLDVANIGVIEQGELVMSGEFVEREADGRAFYGQQYRNISVATPVVAAFALDASQVQLNAGEQTVHLTLPEFMGGAAGAVALRGIPQQGQASTFTGSWFESPVSVVVNQGFGGTTLDTKIVVAGQTVYAGQMPQSTGSTYGTSYTVNSFTPSYHIDDAAAVQTQPAVSETWEPYRVYCQFPDSLAGPFMQNHKFYFGGREETLVEKDGVYYIGTDNKPTVFVAPLHVRSVLTGGDVANGNETGIPDVFTYSGTITSGGSASGTVVTIKVSRSTNLNGDLPPATIQVTGTVVKNANDTNTLALSAPGGGKFEIVGPDDTVIGEMEAGAYSGTLSIQLSERSPASFVAVETNTKATLAAKAPFQNMVGGSTPAWTGRVDVLTGQVGLVWNEDDNLIFLGNESGNEASAPIGWLFPTNSDGTPLELADGQGLRLVEAVRLALLDQKAPLDVRGDDRTASSKEYLVQEFAFMAKELAYLDKQQIKAIFDYIITEGELWYTNEDVAKKAGYRKFEIVKEFRTKDGTLNLVEVLKKYNKNAADTTEKLRKEWLETRGRTLEKVGWTFDFGPAAVYKALVFAQSITDPTLMVSILAGDQSVWQPESGPVTWAACGVVGAWLIVDFLPGGKIASVVSKKVMSVAKAMYKRVAKAGDDVASLAAAMRAKPRAVGKVDKTNVRTVCAGGSCFTAGTMVQTERGWKPIESISLGDRVLACDVQTGQVAFKPVLMTFVTQNKDIAQVRVRGSDGSTTVVTGTLDHPVWSTDRHAWIELSQVSVGEAVGCNSLNAGSVRVVGVTIESRHAAVDTYNFTVGSYHTYVVGSETCPILVHNTNNTKCFNDYIEERNAVAGNPNIFKTDPKYAALPPGRKFFLGGDASKFKYPAPARVKSWEPADYNLGNKPWTGTVRVEIESKNGTRYFVTYRDGFPDFSDFADTKYTGLSMRGDVFVDITGTSAGDISSASRSLAASMGITGKQMDELTTKNELVWHHTVDFTGDLSGPGKGAKVRMVLVPRDVHNAAYGGAVHVGGDAVYNWHWQNSIP